MRCSRGRGERTRTFDLSVPNAARYQLRHTPEAIAPAVSIGSCGTPVNRVSTRLLCINPVLLEGYVNPRDSGRNKHLAKRKTREIICKTPDRPVYSGPLEAWCSGLTCSPVKAETAGSNPVASAR